MIEDDDLPPHFDESIYEPEDNPELMFICSVCSKLLDPDYEQWICSSCFMSDSHAYRYAVNPDSQPD